MYQRLTLSSLNAAERIALRNARLRSGQCIRCFQSSHTRHNADGNDEGTPYNAPKQGQTRQQRAALVSEEVRQVQRGQPTTARPSITDQRPPSSTETVDSEAFGNDSRPGSMGDSNSPTREDPTVQKSDRVNAPASEEILPDDSFALPSPPPGFSWLKLDDPVVIKALPKDVSGRLKSPVEGSEIAMAVRNDSTQDVFIALARDVPASATEEADTEFILYSAQSKELVRNNALLEAVAESVDFIEGAQEEMKSLAYLDSLRNKDGSLKLAPLPEGYEWMSVEDILESGLPYNETEDSVPSPVDGAESRGYVRSTQSEDVFAVVLTSEEAFNGIDDQEPQIAEVSLYNMRSREVLREGDLVEAVGAAMQAYTDAAEEASVTAENGRLQSTSSPAQNRRSENMKETESLEVDISLPTQFSWLTEDERLQKELPPMDSVELRAQVSPWEPFDYLVEDTTGHVILIFSLEREVEDRVVVQVEAFDFTARKPFGNAELVDSIAEQLTKQINDEVAIYEKESPEPREDQLDELEESTLPMQEELAVLDQYDKHTVGEVDFQPDDLDKKSLLELGQNGSSIAAGNYAGVVEDRLIVAAEPAADGFRHIPYLAEKIMTGQFVRFRSEEEKEEVGKAAKKIAERRARNISAQRGGEAMEPINYEISTLPEGVRKAIVDKMVTGKYDSDGLINEQKSVYPKQPILDSIAKMTRLNDTYLSQDGQRFLKKVQSLLPSMQQSQPPGGKK